MQPRQQEDSVTYKYLSKVTFMGEGLISMIFNRKAPGSVAACSQGMSNAYDGLSALYNPFLSTCTFVAEAFVEIVCVPAIAIYGSSYILNGSKTIGKAANCAERWQGLFYVLTGVSFCGTAACAKMFFLEPWVRDTSLQISYGIGFTNRNCGAEEDNLNYKTMEVVSGGVYATIMAGMFLCGLFQGIKQRPAAVENRAENQATRRLISHV